MDFDLGTSRVYAETKGKNQVWPPTWSHFAGATAFRFLPISWWGLLINIGESKYVHT